MNKKILFSIILYLLLFGTVKAQLPAHVLVGYWQNWTGDPSNPFMKISDVDSRYNVIDLAFVYSTDGTVNSLAFDGIYESGYSDAQFKTDIQSAIAAGKVVLLSVGGGNGSFRITSSADKDVFVAYMKSLITTYGVSGIDIDLENSWNVYMTGTVSNPTDSHTQGMIAGLQELLAWYQTTYSRKMVLTMAPEDIQVCGGLSSYQVSNYNAGSYLPIIEALSSDIDLLTVQLYNSGDMFDLNYADRNPGDADFIVSQTEAIIRGFTCASGLGTYSGIPASKVAVALPACSYVSGDYVDPASVASAVNYLRGIGSQPGSYTLIQSGGYPDLRGMMTWSINYDSISCNSGSNYSYADNYQSLFPTVVTAVTDPAADQQSAYVFPSVTNNTATLQLNSDYAGKNVTLQLVDAQGKLQYTRELQAGTSEQVPINLGSYPAGLYLLFILSDNKRETVRLVKQ